MKIIKKYVLRAFMAPFFKGLAALMLIMTVTHFFDFFHVFLGNRPQLVIVLEYFLNRLPEWLVLIMPVGTLLAVLFSLGSLSRHNELTAIKTSGFQLNYILVPILIFSIAVSILSGILHETVVPKTNARAEELFLVIRNREPERADTDRRNFNYMGEGPRLYAIDHFSGKTASGITIIEFFENTTRENIITYSEKAVYEGGRIWLLYSGTERVFTYEGDMTSYKEFKNLRMPLPETPENFAKPELHPEQMDFFSLIAHIEKLERGGFQTRSERVILHNKIAFPFSNTIILVLGIPLALWSGTRNRTTGFFMSLIICFIYWGAISVGSALGARGVIPPVLGAWSANIIFLALSLAMLKASRIS